jgi:pentatricopeptide repeat protein
VDELLELRGYVEEGDYVKALTLIGEMEEMSREDKVNKIGSFMEVLILHLIKQHAECRSTRSWEVSIKNAVDNIADINKRRKAGGYYLRKEELKETIDERYQRALRRASLEAFEGIFDELELAEKIDEDRIKQEALQMIV